MTLLGASLTSREKKSGAAASGAAASLVEREISLRNTTYASGSPPTIEAVVGDRRMSSAAVAKEGSSGLRVS